MFFQAEGGIRDLVRSRGLGDVYKRQVHRDRTHLPVGQLDDDLARLDVRIFQELVDIVDRCRGDLALLAVSYTHLTLPTSDLV